MGPKYREFVFVCEVYCSEVVIYKWSGCKDESLYECSYSKTYMDTESTGPTRSHHTGLVIGIRVRDRALGFVERLRDKVRFRDRVSRFRDRV